MFDPEISIESDAPKARPLTSVPFGPTSDQRMFDRSVSESK